MARPPLWLVSLVPLYVGHLLATRSLFPGVDRWARFWDRATATGATSHDFWHTLVQFLGDGRKLFVAALVLGPLAWAAAMCLNDVADVAGDQRNPRKQDAPIVAGALSPLAAGRAARVFVLASVLGATSVGPGFLVVTLILLVLAWAYSVEPLRLKTRPGADVVTNAVGVGALPLLAGWTIARPLGAFPWVMLLQGAMVAVALYVPTTLVDYEADIAAGYDTVAWAGANAGAIVLSALGAVFPRPMLPLLIVCGPLLVVAYRRLLAHERDAARLVRGIVVMSWLFLVPSAVFALMYTGLWAGD